MSKLTYIHTYIHILFAQNDIKTVHKQAQSKMYKAQAALTAASTTEQTNTN